MAKNIKLGARVEYRDSSGYVKLGLVTGTSDSVQDNEKVSKPSKGETAHLFILSPSGKTYAKQNVPLGNGPATFSLL